MKPRAFNKLFSVHVNDKEISSGVTSVYSWGGIYTALLTKRQASFTLPT